MQLHPVLWTFRRCPYAIRARLALASAQVAVEVREVVLRNKPEAFLQCSMSGTVPTLDLGGTVIDESLDIMVWALKRQDPEGLLEMPRAGWALISDNDGPFKTALDHTKYSTRYVDVDADQARETASGYLKDLKDRLSGNQWLFGDRPTLADLALLPFVRQFAFIDRAWFDAQPWPDLIAWLDPFLESARFAQVMDKYPAWQEGQPATVSAWVAQQH